jgi:replicative DNA helicase
MEINNYKKDRIQKKNIEITMRNKIEIIQRFDKILNKIIQLRDELKQQKEEKTVTTTIEELTNVGKSLQNKQNKSIKYSELRREWLKLRD